MEKFKKDIMFFDGEFCGLFVDGINFLSVAFVKEDGESLYLEIEQAQTKCADWVSEHVFPKLKGEKVSEEDAKKKIINFLGGKEFYIVADVNQFDWMGLCKLFGLLTIPFKYIPIDFASMLFDRDIDPDIDREPLAESLGLKIPESHRKHHALSDALLLRNMYNSLKNRCSICGGKMVKPESALIDILCCIECYS